MKKEDIRKDINVEETQGVEKTEEKGKNKVKKHSEEDINRIIDLYILGEPIEKDYDIRGKIKYTLRSVPEKAMQNIYSLIGDKDFNIGISLENMYNGLLAAAYISEYLKGTDKYKNFVSEDMYSKEALSERYEYLNDHINLQLRSAIIRDIKDFQQLLAEAFDPDSLLDF